MKLKNIRISNYRCFKEAKIDFDDHITLIVGKNGAGKTAILDVVAVSVSTFLLGIDGGVSRSVLKDDARYEFHDLNGMIKVHDRMPLILEKEQLEDWFDDRKIEQILHQVPVQLKREAEYEQQSLFL